MELRQTHFPYCLQRLDDGRYILVNRRYKPLGVQSNAWVTYETHPTAFPLKIIPTAARKLSYEGSADVDKIYLYNDGCVPTESAAHMKSYFHATAPSVLAGTAQDMENPRARIDGANRSTLNTEASMADFALLCPQCVQKVMQFSPDLKLDTPLICDHCGHFCKLGQLVTTSSETLVKYLDSLALQRRLGIKSVDPEN